MPKVKRKEKTVEIVRILNGKYKGIAVLGEIDGKIIVNTGKEKIPLREAGDMEYIGDIYVRDIEEGKLKLRAELIDGSYIDLTADEVEFTENSVWFRYKGRNVMKLKSDEFLKVRKII